MKLRIQGAFLLKSGPDEFMASSKLTGMLVKREYT